MLLKVNPGLRLSAAALLKHPFINVAKSSFPKKRMVGLLNNLKLNAQNCEFTRFVVRVVAEQMPSDGRQAETVEKAFRCLDTDGDGILSTSELVKGLHKYLGLSDSEQEELFSLIDRDGSGTLNVNEFISATMDQRRIKTLPVLWQAFNAFDRDQGGEITFDELDAIVMELEGALTSKDSLKHLCAQIRSELSAVCTNDTLDFDQFVYIMQNQDAKTDQVVKREMYRFFWKSCKVDCYKVRHLSNKHWDLHRVAMAASSRSAYRKNHKNRTASAKVLQGAAKRASTAVPDEAG